MKQLGFLLGVFLCSSALCACSCAPPGKLDEKQFEYYDFIAQGEILKVEESGEKRQFWLKIAELYKGDANGDVMISTALSSAACGLVVHEGDSWLIYARRKGGMLTTGLCTRSLPLKAEGMNEAPARALEDLRFLETKISFSSPANAYSIGVIDHFQSKKLGEERTLNICLPDGYQQNDTVHYPVIYLLDGSADEDFEHVAGLLQFSNFPWLSYMPQCIIVGIANTDRKHDFTFPTTLEQEKKNYPTTGGSAAFISFLEEELQPYIQENYKANGPNMLIGQSLGGLLATEVLYKKPELFRHYFIVSPSLYWGDYSLLHLAPVFLKPGFEQQISVYIAVGKEGRVMKKVARKLAKTVKKSPVIQSEFHYFKDEDHASILHIALYQGFKSFKERTGRQ